METRPFEDVVPIENGDNPLLYVSLPEGIFFCVAFTPRNSAKMTTMGLRFKIQFLKHEMLLNFVFSAVRSIKDVADLLLCFLELISEFQVFARKVCSIIFSNVYLLICHEIWFIH